MKTIFDLEFRFSIANNKYELVRWFKDVNKRYCIVIAFFNKTSEGCDIEFIGKRPFETESDESVWALLKYGQSIVDAEIKLEEDNDRMS